MRELGQGNRLKLISGGHIRSIGGGGGGACAFGAAIAAALVALTHDALAGTAALTVLGIAAFVCERSSTACTGQLVLARRTLWIVRPLGAFAALEGALLALSLPVWHLAIAGAAILATLPGMLVRFRDRRAVVRIGVIGTSAAAARLQAELDGAGKDRHVVVVALVPPRAAPAELDTSISDEVLEALPQAVARWDVGLLVVTSGAATLAAVRAAAGPTRVTDLVSFHEQTFGSVPVAEVDAAWFTALPNRADSPAARAAKRAIDIAVALPLALLALPIIALLAFLVRRHDGGPAFFRQQRVGERGRIFELCKLRTMTLSEVDAQTQWTTVDDTRVTPIGRILRETHLDELPQLFSILRGEMTLVGPRPEQVGYTTELNGRIPFYARRLDVKPGLTGWAQVRCGYAGSVEGSAYKLCNDLYYLKHRGLALDLAILLETVHAVVTSQRFDIVPANASTLLGSDEQAILSASAPATATATAAAAA
jgi:lipopolysaccharide/colanic/teichoic acid biosynthesis glycosyltransferase